MSKLEDNKNEIKSLQDELFWRLEDDDYKDFLVQSLAMKKGEQVDSLAWMCDTHLVLAQAKYLALRKAEEIMTNRKNSAGRAVNWLQGLIINTATASGIAHIHGDLVEYINGHFEWLEAPTLPKVPQGIDELLVAYSDNIHQQAVYKDLLERSIRHCTWSVGRGDAIRATLLALMQEQGIEKTTNGVVSVRVDKGRESVDVLDAYALPEHLKSIIYTAKVSQCYMNTLIRQEDANPDDFVIKHDAKAVKEAINAGEVLEDVAVIVKKPFVVVRGA